MRVQSYTVLEIFKRSCVMVEGRVELGPRTGVAHIPPSPVSIHLGSKYCACVVMRYYTTVGMDRT
jgi:hypothetical protein